MQNVDAQTQNSGSVKKVNLLQSIKLKILLLVILAIVTSTLINLLTSIPLMQKEVTGLVKDYMCDLVKITGQTLDKEIELVGREKVMDLEELSDILEDVYVGNMSSSYAYMVDADGVMVYHQVADKIGKPVENEAVKQVLQQLSQGNRLETDVITYKFKGVNKYASFYVGQGMDYVLIVTADEAEALSVITNLIIRNIIVSIVILIICAVIAMLVATQVMKPIMSITGSITKLSELDFTEDKKAELLARRKDETGILANAAVVLQKKFVDLISNMRVQSTSLYDASESMNGNANEITRSVEQMEKAVNEIADGATSQAQETQTATENIILMGDMIQETNQEVEDLRANARIMRSAGEKAMEILAELGAINQQTKDAIQVIYNQTTHTNSSVAEIKKATDIITDIAEETNLLSLNASIEAARAGEAGRGFAVVASQIQQLADQSNASASQIAATITALITEFDETMKTMEAVKEVIAKQDEDVTNTENAFNAVKDGISKSIDGIRAIAAKTAQLDEARVKVVDVVQNLTAIAQENAASTEETSATAAEVSTIMGNMASNAEQLHKIANELEESIKQFCIEK